MTDEKEKELQKIKVDAYIKIKELQHRICRVGGYISGLQCQLSEHMDFYHQADRELADQHKLTVIESNKSKPKTMSVEDILKNPAMSKVLFEELKKMNNDKVIESLQVDDLD